MAHGVETRACKGWHEGHSPRVIIDGGRPLVVCDRCLAVADFASSYPDRESAYECGPGEDCKFDEIPCEYGEEGT